jgi:hypothetical protein
MKDLWFGILKRGGSFIGYRLEPITIEPFRTKGLAITGEFTNVNDVLIRICGEIQMIGSGYHVHLLTVPFENESFI